MVPPHRRTQQGRPLADGGTVRRCRASHGSNPRHKSRHTLSLLRVDAMPAWRSQNRVRIGLPRSRRRETIVKALKERLTLPLGDRGAVADLVAGIVVHRDSLIVRLKSDNADEASDSQDDQSLLIPWQNPPSKRSRQILLPHNKSRSEVRPEQFERRARLVSAIARGRRWLDEVVSGRVTTVAQLCAREKCSVRQVNMTISLAFLAPNLVKAAVEGRLPRGIGVERLRDPPAEWSRQFEALGLNPGPVRRCQSRGSGEPS